MPKLCNSCSKCYGMDNIGTYFTHAKPNVTRVQSATQCSPCHWHHHHSWWCFPDASQSLIKGEKLAYPRPRSEAAIVRSGKLDLRCHSTTSRNRWKSFNSGFWDQDGTKEILAKAPSFHCGKPNLIHVQVLRNGLPGYILCTCVNLM